MATSSSNNSFIRNGELYILPTLTSDVIGQNAIFNGYTFNLTGCTNTNLTACGAVSNSTSGAVINPVMSARISTKGKRSIQYGRVEVRAKLPRGYVDRGNVLPNLVTNIQPDTTFVLGTGFVPFFKFVSA
jgi:hypothetical protein